MNFEIKKIKNEYPVIIIGAGLSGLACAMTLQKNKVPFLLLDQSDSVGGRIKTTLTEDGYRFDHGFQVLLTSYPELKNFIDLKKLNLKLFNSGSLIYTGSEIKLLANPFLHPSRLIREVLSNLVSFKDKILIVKLILEANFLFNGEKYLKLKNISTIQFLQSFGFSRNFIHIFWTPFLTGVFLDPSLSIGADFFMFLIKGFSSGRVAVPAFGMQEIPNQMMQTIDSGHIRLNTSVQKIATDHVILTNGQRIEAQKVVVTYNINSSEDDHYSVQNFYFTTSEKLDWGSWLVIVPQNLGLSISTIVIMNQVSDSYAKNSNENLLSVSVVGSESVSVEKIETEIRKISNLPLTDLKLVRKFEILKALPKMTGLDEKYFKFENGIYYCGDWTTSPSINGALKSGRLVAENIVSILGS